MIVCKEFPDKQFSTKEEMFTHLRENKKSLIAAKKMITKECDAVFYISKSIDEKGEVIKVENTSLVEINKLKATLVINTTKLLDSHGDVHLDGIWNKSAKESKDLLLLQEHQMKFDKIISDDVKATVKNMLWKELGADYTGYTEALVFECTIEKNRNEFMFNQYVKGFVKNHSVGMRYVKLELAINSESKWDVEEKEVWDKYINQIVNKEYAESIGYFWVVPEAKIIEGSAVVKGSNSITPTLEITEASKGANAIEPSEDTQKKEAAKALQENKRLLLQILNT